MRVLVNALSVSNASGRHVLLGHLSRFAKWTAERHEYVVLYNKQNCDIRRDLGPNVEWVECPGYTSGWVGRSLWERTSLGAIVRGQKCDVVYSPAGIVTPGIGIPQVSFAQNPWALVPALDRTPLEEAKAALQRQGYRQAMQSARMMVFNSKFMHEAYRRNAGTEAHASRIIYQGIDEETFAAAQAARGSVARKRLQIVSVSAMAPHKGVETVVAAVARLRKEYGLGVTLLLIGEWPDLRYRRRIEEQVRRALLTDAVVFAGHVTRDELHRAYAESQVFCLMSRCESFGIPAVEAQSFGTPVVSSNCCAIPEVCGDGGLFPEPGRDDEVAVALASLLTDRTRWESLSSRALANAERFHWDACSRPYVELFDTLLDA